MREWMDGTSWHFKNIPPATGEAGGKAAGGWICCWLPDDRAVDGPARGREGLVGVVAVVAVQHENVALPGVAAANPVVCRQTACAAGHG
jgi:hypothetical protein